MSGRRGSLFRITKNTKRVVVSCKCTYLWPVPPCGPHLMRPPTHQFVNGHHDLRELGSCDATVTVYIIQFKRPAQFLVNRSSEKGRERHQ